MVGILLVDTECSIELDELGADLPGAEYRVLASSSERPLYRLSHSQDAHAAEVRSPPARRKASRMRRVFRVRSERQLGGLSYLAQQAAGTANVGRVLLGVISSN